MQILYLIISLIFVSGFYFLGEKIVSIFKLKFVISNISSPAYQYTSIGIVLLIFFYILFFFLDFSKLDYCAKFN